MQGNQKNQILLPIMMYIILFNLLFWFYQMTVCAQTDSLFEHSKREFLKYDINTERDSTVNDKLYYIRQCYATSNDFKKILTSISELKSYPMIYIVNISKSRDTVLMTFAQYESNDEIINDFCIHKNTKIEGCITINNASFYVQNMGVDESIIKKILRKSDSYIAIMKLNYPKDSIPFYFHDNLPIFIIDKGKFYEYAGQNDK